MAVVAAWLVGQVFRGCKEQHMPLSPTKQRMQALQDLAPSANKDQLTFLEQLDQEAHA